MSDDPLTLLPPDLINKARAAIEDGLKKNRKTRTRCPRCDSRIEVEIADVEGRVRAARALLELYEQLRAGEESLVVERIIISPEQAEEMIPGFKRA